MFLVPTVHIELSDIVDAKLFLLQLDLVGIGSKFRSERSDVVWEGGGEENNLNPLARKKA